MTLAEVADHLRLNVETVRRYVRSGKLRAIRLGGGRAGYRVPSEELDKLAPSRDAQASRSADWPDDPGERVARLEALFREVDAIPGNRDLPSLSVEVIREMREANG